MKKDDVGIAMEKNGTDVCKDAGDMIIVNDDFHAIIATIEDIILQPVWEQKPRKVKQPMIAMVDSNFSFECQHDHPLYIAGVSFGMSDNGLGGLPGGD